MNILTEEDDIIAIDGKRYVDLGGIYALIIEEDELKELESDLH